MYSIEYKGLYVFYLVVADKPKHLTNLDDVFLTYAGQASTINVVLNRVKQWLLPFLCLNEVVSAHCITRELCDCCVCCDFILNGLERAAVIHFVL